MTQQTNSLTVEYVMADEPKAPADDLNLKPAFPGGVPAEYQDPEFVKYVRERKVAVTNAQEAAAAHAAYRRMKYSKQRFGG